MSLAGLLAYLTGAAGYALAAGAVLLALGRIAGWRPGAAQAGLVFAVAFVIFLGLYPFPALEAVVCKAPILQPFHFLNGYVDYWRRDVPPGVWLRSNTITTPVANFLFFAVVGALLATQTRRAGVALMLGAGVSGAIEISQLSGLYGIYPCPYRTFETDDLILNTAGVLAGFLASHRLRQA